MNRNDKILSELIIDALVLLHDRDKRIRRIMQGPMRSVFESNPFKFYPQVHCPRCVEYERIEIRESRMVHGDTDYILICCRCGYGEKLTGSNLAITRMKHRRDRRYDFNMGRNRLWLD